MRISSVYDNPLTIVNYLLRALVLHNIIISILEILIVYLMTADSFFYVYKNVNMVGYIITYITLFMVIVRKDNRGLHDMVARTKVVKISDNKMEREQAVLIHEQEIKKEKPKKVKESVKKTPKKKTVSKAKKDSVKKN